MVLVRAVVGAVALAPLAQCLTTIKMTLTGTCADDDGTPPCNGGTLAPARTINTGATQASSNFAGILTTAGEYTDVPGDVFTDASFPDFTPTKDAAGAAITAANAYMSTQTWTFGAAAFAPSPTATTSAAIVTRDLTVTLVQDWLDDSLNAQYNGGTHTAIGVEADLNTVFGTSWAKNAGSAGGKSATLFTDQDLTTATGGYAVDKALGEMVTDAVDGTSRTFTSGFKTILVLAPGSADNAVKTTNETTQKVTLNNSSCAKINALLIAFHSSTQTDSSMIACSAAAVVDAESAHTVTMWHSSEYDMKWAAAALSTFTNDNSANTDGLLFDGNNYGVTATLTSVSIHDLDGATMASGSQTNYGAKVEVSKAAATYEANEACMLLLKDLRRRAFHSVWAACESTAATAGAVSTATMTFYHEHDIAATLRALYDVFANGTLALTSLKPTEIKDGSVTDANGTAVFAAIPSVSATWNSDDDAAADGQEAKTGLYAVATSACGVIASRITATVTSNPVVWCDDGSAAAGAGAADGATVTLYFGSRHDLWTLRGALTHKETGRATAAMMVTADLAAATYKMTYALTAAADATIAATAVTTDQTELSPFSVNNSGCKFADVGTDASKAMWCSSDATTMTLYFSTPAQAKAHAVALKAKAITTPFSTIVPTGANDLGATASLLQSITYTATQDNVSTEWIASGPGTGATSACGNAETTNAIYCAAPKGTAVDMTLYYLTEADFITDAKLNAAKTTGTIAADTDTLTQQYVPNDGETYTVEYTITLKADADGATTDYTSVSRGELARAGSACNAYKKSNAIFCTSNVNSSMTLHYTSAAKRKIDSLLIAASASAAPALSAKPKTVKDLTVTVPLLSVKYLAHFDTDAATDAWSAANGSTSTASSACKVAASQITAGNDMITYCDSLAASGSEMELLFFSVEDAQTTMRDLKVVSNGSGDKAVRAFVPVASQFYEAKYSLAAYTDADGVASTIVAQTSSTAGDGCSYLSSTKDIYCECTTTETTQYFLTAANRLTDMNKSAALVGKSAVNIGSVMVSGVVNKDLTGVDTSVGSLVSISYTANDNEGAAWASASSGGPIADSACQAAKSGLSSYVACESAAGTGAKTTLQWVASAGNEYIIDARNLAVKTNTDDSQIFVLQSASPTVEVYAFTADTTTTTAAARARRSLTEVGSVASTGGFATASSWCQTLKDTATSAIFCVSATDSSAAPSAVYPDSPLKNCRPGNVCLSYLDAALAAADIRSLEALKDYAVLSSLDPARRLEIGLTVNKSIAEDGLCGAMEKVVDDIASCKHDAVTVETGTRRRLSTADVTVNLGFASAAAFDAAVVAGAALAADPSALEAAGVTAVSSVTDGSGNVVGGDPVAPSPTSDSDDTDDGSDGTSTATLRVVSLLGLVGFVLA